MIVIIDYNVGNLLSVEGACKRIGVDYVISRDKAVIESAKAIILPGVGSFDIAMNNLKEYDLIDVLTKCKNKGTPILGICLGMQILFEKGYEGKVTNGLAFIEGEVRYMDIDQKIPHMGWNQLHIKQDNPIVKYTSEDDDVYFVHSYMAHCPSDNIIATTDYGNNDIVAIVAKDNVYGCQFHPEKSQATGMQILKAFKEMIK